MLEKFYVLAILFVVAELLTSICFVFIHIHNRKIYKSVEEGWKITNRLHEAWIEEADYKIKRLDLDWELTQMEPRSKWLSNHVKRIQLGEMRLDSDLRMQNESRAYELERDEAKRKERKEKEEE